MADFESMRQLAREWWAFHRDKGLLEAPEASFDSAQLNRVDESVETLASRPETLGRILECLALEAPAENEVPFIGTWVLEDIYETRERAAAAVRASGVPTEVARRILSGVLAGEDGTA